jgi:hypothetical protein
LYLIPAVRWDRAISAFASTLKELNDDVKWRGGEGGMISNKGEKETGPVGLTYIYIITFFPSIYTLLYFIYIKAIMSPAPTHGKGYGVAGMSSTM